jgi:hypothetical protein
MHKKAAANVAKIDTCCKFFPATFAMDFSPTNFKAKTINTLKLRKTLWHEKAAAKLLVKLAPKVNFINILGASFASENYKAKL